jgi:hypothetical protein
MVGLQRIPIWWRWYSWACPVAWTLYGLVASQYGDIADVRMEKRWMLSVRNMQLTLSGGQRPHI